MKKAISAVFILLVVVLIMSIGMASAVEKVSTGFYWPVGESNFNSASGGWLSRDKDHGGKYFKGLYHIGVDMMTDTYDINNENSHVYAIADGTVIYVHQSSDWGVTDGVNNVMVFIQHKTKDGIDFIGYYGHLQFKLADGVGKNKPVKAGQLIGYTGDYPTGIHLHFGIRKGNSLSPSPWGRMPNSSWPSTNGFINPVEFIKTHSPYVEYDETTTACVGNICWEPRSKDCQDADAWYRLKGVPYADRVGIEVCDEKSDKPRMKSFKPPTPPKPFRTNTGGNRGGEAFSIFLAK